MSRISYIKNTEENNPDPFGFLTAPDYLGARVSKFFSDLVDEGFICNDFDGIINGNSIFIDYHFVACSS